MFLCFKTDLNDDDDEKGLIKPLYNKAYKVVFTSILLELHQPKTATYILTQRHGYAVPIYKFLLTRFKKEMLRAIFFKRLITKYPSFHRLIVAARLHLGHVFPFIKISYVCTLIKYVMDGFLNLFLHVFGIFATSRLAKLSSSRYLNMPPGMIKSHHNASAILYC